jgi:hypothetical protein
LLYQSPALQVAGAGDQIAITEPLRDRPGLRRGPVGRLVTVPGELLLRFRQQEIALLHAVTTIYETAGPTEPSCSATHLPPQQKAQTGPERAAGSSHAVAGVQIFMMSAIECREKILVPPAQVCRYGQPFEILDSQWLYLIRE